MHVPEAFRRRGTRFDLGRAVRVFTEGEPCRDVPWLTRGTLRVFRTSGGGREGTLYLLGPGEICAVGALSALRGLPLPATAVTEDECSGLFVPAPVFREALRDGAFLDRFLDDTAQRFSGLLGLMQEIQFRSIERRVADYLLDRARTVPGTGTARLPTTQERIAADLWTAREVVSRSLRAFESRGWVALGRGVISVLDASALSRAAEDS